MPRFEVHDEGVQSFWEITLAGKTYTLRWGRVGSRGQSRVRHFASNDEARRDYDKQIAAKTRKGYRLVAGTEEPGSFVRSGVTAPPAARNAELEAAVIADPSDEAALLVLGDWLETQGDPRGALIALQAAQTREKDPARFFALKVEATAHYGRHEAALVGPLDPWRHLFTLDWHLGYIRGAKLSFAARRDGDPGPAELVTALVALPSSVALQELAIGSPGNSRDPAAGRYADLLAHLCTTGEPRALRSLHLGAYWPGTVIGAEDGFLGDLGELAGRFPALRRIVVAHGRIRLGAPFLNLRELVHRTPIDAAMVDWIQRTPLPQLEQLELAVGYHSEPFRTALDPARLPKLRQLRLTNSSYTEGLVIALAHSHILPQLEVVDLSNGNLDDEAAGRILAFHDAFRHLQRWRLGPQHVTYNAYLRLRDAGIDISLPKAYQKR